MKLTNIRHWDMALIGIKELPKWLKITKSNIMMTWSHWNNHYFDTGKLYITTPVEKLWEHWRVAEDLKERYNK